ncbi:Hypothetical protein HVR_LOCUS1289 [uncultured virus]|nr:Hypothetical protein HVR_LOCUS1289 [uncultured virus]
MAQPYPLYDELVKRVEARNEKGIDIKRVCTTINGISQSMRPEDANHHYAEIAALILHYEITSNSGVLLSPIPYDGKVMAGGKGILHYPMNLPPLLQQIIAQYIEDSATFETERARTSNNSTPSMNNALPGKLNIWDSSGILGNGPINPTLTNLTKRSVLVSKT